MEEINKGRVLLSKLYECQEMMEELLDKGKDDEHYFMICDLINRLELYLQNNQDLL